MRTRSDARAAFGVSTLAFAFALALTLAPAAARAQTAKPTAKASAEARVEFEEGARLYDAGKYDAAVARFEKAYALSGAPALLLNIAQAYRLKGACREAASFYERFLGVQRDSPHRAEVEERLAEMKSCREAPPPKEAPVAPVPLPAPVAPVTTPPPPAAPASSSAPASPPPDSTPASDAGVWRAVGWTGAGVAVVGSAVALTTLVLTLDRKSELDRTCAADGGCPTSERSTLDSYKTLRTVSWVGAAVAGVGVGVAVFGFWLASSGKGDARLEAWLSPTQLGLRGAFD